MKRILVSLAVLGLLAGAAQAQEKKTMAVSVPTADHGWTGGVVFHAMEEAKALEKKYPGLKVIVKTSPDPAAQANALEDLSTQGIDALVVLPHDPERADRPDPQGEGQGDVRHRRRSHRERPLDLRPLRRRRQSGPRRVGGGLLQAEDARTAATSSSSAACRSRSTRCASTPSTRASRAPRSRCIDSQFGNWSRDDAFKVMQDFLTKHPKIDAVWCQDDDMAVGVFEAIAQAKRTDIKFVVAGAGSKDMVKRVMDGDPMMPVDVLYSPTMVAVAMDVTALGLEDKIPVRGDYILKASLITKDNAKDFYFKDSPF